jgi:truncated hemoglobin YjbI
LVRLVHRESGQVASEHDVSHMTGSEIENWAKYLEATTDAAGYSVEVQGLEGGAR